MKQNSSKDFVRVTFSDRLRREKKIAFLQTKPPPKILLKRCLTINEAVITIFQEFKTLRRHLGVRCYALGNDSTFADCPTTRLQM